jgi:hypothetical protein
MISLRTRVFFALTVTGMMVADAVHAAFDGRYIAAAVYAVIWFTASYFGQKWLRRMDQADQAATLAEQQREFVTNIAIKRSREAAFLLNGLLEVRAGIQVGNYDGAVSTVHDTLAEWNDKELAIKYLHEWLDILEDDGVLRPATKAV